MRFRLLLCIALLIFLPTVAAGDTAVFNDTVYVFPTEAVKPATLTLSVTGVSLDTQTLELVEEPGLAGAVFGIYAKDAQGAFVPYPDPANPLQPLTITSRMSAVSLALPRGVDLYIRQDAAPEGYVAEEEAYRLLSLPETILVENYKENMQGLWLTLVGDAAEGEAPLANVRFELEGERTYTLRTDAEGKASVSGVEPGTYALRQLDSADGYHIDTPEQEITIPANTPVEWTLRNSADGAVTLRVLGLTADGTMTPRLIPIARRYEVLDASGVSLGTLAPGETLSLRATREGVAYTARGVDAAADGFTQDTQNYEITLYSGQTSMIQPVVKSERGFFSFEHISTEAGAPVAGGLFELTDETEKVVLAFEADGEGRYTPASPLLPGTYTLRMTQAADGYLFASEPSFVQITPYFSEGYPVTAVTFASTPVPAEMEAPDVYAEEMRTLPSLFDSAAEITFTLRAFREATPLEVEGLTFELSFPELEGLEVVEETASGATVRIARRVPFDEVPEIRSLIISGTVSYTYEYPVDAKGTPREAQVSAPFTAQVAGFEGAKVLSYAVKGHVYDEKDAPMAGQRVTLEREEDGEVLAETLTDPYGAYAFETMPENAVVRFYPTEGLGVKVEETDAYFLPQRTLGGHVAYYGELEPEGVSLSVEGETVPVKEDGSFSITGIFAEDVAIAAEAQPGVLVRINKEGTQTLVQAYAEAIVSGGVTDPEGNPVEGLAVTLAGEGTRVRVETGADGAFRMEGLFPGTYTLTYSAPKGYVLNSARSESLTLEAGEEKTLPLVEAMVPAAIEGKLLDGDLPYTGVQVALLPVGHTVLTDEEGVFAFEGLSAGAYSLRFDTPEDTIFLDMPEETRVERSGERVDHIIHTVRPASLAGRIWYDANDDGLQTYNEEGQPDVQVALLDASEKVVAELRTETDGGFVFGDLVPGRYKISLTLPGDLIFSREAPDAERIVVGVDAAEGVSEWYTLASGEQRTDLAAGAIKSAYIEGLVWEDLSGNGVYEAEEPGLADISVTLLRSGEVVAETVTDATGAYRLTGLRTLDYVLRIVLPDGYIFTLPAAEGTDGLCSSFSGQVAAVDEVEVSLRRWRMDGTVYAGAQRVGVARAHVWFDTVAAGLDPGVDGYEGLTVALYRMWGERANLVERKQTDASGDVVFDTLRPGQYRLGYILPDAASWGFTVGTEETRDGEGFGGVFTLTGGADVKASSVGIAQLGRISGVVFEDGDYNGLRDEGEGGLSATVTLLSATGEELGRKQAKPDGTYLFGSLLPGRYSLRFEIPEGYAFTMNRSDAPSYNSDVPETQGLTADSDMVYLPMGETVLVDAGVYRPGSIRGSAWMDKENTGVSSWANPPVKGLEIALLRAGETVQTVKTDENGAYRFDQLPPGAYALQVSLAQGMRFSKYAGSANGGSVMPDTDELTGVSDPLTLRNGENKGGVEIGVVQTGGVFGTVISAKDAAGLPDARVVLRRGGESVAETLTDATGAYAFEEIRPGGLELLLEVSEEWIIPQEAENPLQIRVEQGARTEAPQVRCVPEAILEGALWLDADASLTWDEGETPMQSASVELYRMEGELPHLVNTRKTDAQGQYRFDGLLSDRYTLQLRPAADVVFYGESEISPIELTMGETRTLEHPAYVAASIAGSVWEDVNNDGQRGLHEPVLPAVLVELVGQDERVLMEMETDEEGQYAFEDIPPVTCALRFTLPEEYIFATQTEGGSVVPEADENSAMTEEISLAMGETIKDFDVGVLRHTRIGDLVWLDSDGNGLQDTGEEGIPDITVKLYLANGEKLEPLAETVTDANGRYRFDTLRPGTYAVSFEIGKAYLPTKPTDTLPQINSKLPWEQAEELTTEPFVAQSGRYQLTVDAGLVPVEDAEALGWIVKEDGTVEESREE